MDVCFGDGVLVDVRADEGMKRQRRVLENELQALERRLGN